MALTDDNNGSIPATMLVGPATLGNTAQPMPYYVPMMGGSGGGNGGGNGGMWGGDGSWIILLIIVLLAAGGGWGNNNGGNQGGFGGGTPIIVNDGGNQGYAVQRGFDQAAVMSGVGAIQSGISALSTQLCNCCGDIQQSLCNGFAGVNASISNGFAQAEIANNARQIADMQQNFAAQTATMQGFNGLQSQLAQCCCDNRLATNDLKYTIATENCADRAAAAENTRDIIDVINNRAQGIENKLCQLELDGVKQNYENRIASLQNALDQSRSDNQGLRFVQSQTAQNALFQQGMNNEVDALYNRLRNCPVPSMPVYGMQPIFTCQPQNNCGCGCGNNSF